MKLIMMQTTNIISMAISLKNSPTTGLSQAIQNTSIHHCTLSITQSLRFTLKSSPRMIRHTC